MRDNNIFIHFFYICVMPKDMVIERYPSCYITMDPTPRTPMSSFRCVVCKGRCMCGHFPCPILSSIRIHFDEPVLRLRRITGLCGPAVSSREGDGVVLYLDAPPEGGCRGERMRSLFYSCAVFLGRAETGGGRISDALCATEQVHATAELEGAPVACSVFDAVNPPYCHCARAESLRVHSSESRENVNDSMPFQKAVPALYAGGALASRIASCAPHVAPGDRRRVSDSRIASLTAYCMCGKEAIRQVKGMRVSKEHAVFVSRYCGNEYAMLVLPRPWEFELFESWDPGTIWTLGETRTCMVHEHENYRGASDRGLREGGSYYPFRLAAAEALLDSRAQGAVLAFRSVHAGSSVPLGSCEVYEAVASAERVGTFDSLGPALDCACGFVGIAPEKVISASTMLSQGTLGSWLE